ncbi:MAG: helix-turn-helix domain-containing protein [Candidatus Omnitrophica bacterium]|jgi:excisionase family DNA binding protein|nr:helix-turn-helix domain-containing protein [Candidatus Omnitrophota bacterium]
MKEKKSKEIMTAKDVADYLGLHPLTVHRYARQGKIPAFKIGTDWRFHRKYIERWIKEKLTCQARAQVVLNTEKPQS